MRVIFLSGGARDLALRHLLENKVNVIAVITPVPSASNKRFLSVIATAQEFGIPVINVTKETVSSAVKKLDFDVLVSCGFSYIFDHEAIAAAKKMAINVHPTLLPKYRGFRSGPFIILNGELKSGVTIHQLTEEMDKGDILAQKEFPVSIFDTTTSVFRKAKELEPFILLETLQRIKMDTYQLVPQDESQATTYNQIRTPKDSEIDWNKSLKDLYNEIRASNSVEYPAHFYLKGEKVNIKIWRETKPDDEFDLI